MQKDIWWPRKLEFLQGFMRAHHDSRTKDVFQARLDALHEKYKDMGVAKLSRSQIAELCRQTLDYEGANVDESFDLFLAEGGGEKSGDWLRA